MARLIDDWLTQTDGPLRTYARQAKELRDVEARLIPVLPPDLRPHCRLARINPEAMVWIAATSAWATRLRFHTQDLLAAAQRERGARAPRSVQVKVASEPPASPEIKSPPARAPSPAAAAALAELAATTRDPGLREAVNRLAELARQPEESGSTPRRGRGPG
jgi:hypothetical protein